MNNEHNDFAWSTRKEKYWLETIGQSINTDFTGEKPDKITMLERYIKSCENRKDWGIINKKSCIMYAKRLIILNKDLIG